MVQLLQVILYAPPPARAGAPGHPPARAGLCGAPALLVVAGLLRSRPGRALGGGARCRLRCGVSPGRLGLQDPSEALRRAPRPRGDTCLRRVHRGVGVGASGVALGTGVLVGAVLGSRSQRPCGGPTSTSHATPSGGSSRPGRGAGEAGALDSYSYLAPPMVARDRLLPHGARGRPWPTARSPLGTIRRCAVRGVGASTPRSQRFQTAREGSVSRPRLVVAVLCLALISVRCRCHPDSPSLSLRRCCALWQRSRRRLLASSGVNSEGKVEGAEHGVFTQTCSSDSPNFAC